MRMIKKISSRIKYKFLFSNCIVLFCILCFYLIFCHISERLLQEYIFNQNLISAQSDKSCFALQQYIDTNHLSINDISYISQWDEEHPYLFVKLYNDQTLIYDSIWNVTPEKFNYSESNSISTESYYAIEFSDGTVTALFYPFYKQKVLIIIKGALFLLSFLFFVISNFFFIGRKIKYIDTLNNELNALSTGNFTNPISVYGTDELTNLATGIELLQIAVLEKIQTEKEAYTANHELITALSHDLRTPLTSLIGYLEISLDESLCPVNQIPNYQRAALAKANRLKELTDKLFEYFLVTSHRDELSLELVNGNELIFQMVEEPLSNLESSDIKIIRDVSEINCQLYVNINLIHRAFENIFSNIRKYANLSHPIYVKYYMENNNLFLSIKNSKRTDTFNENSTKIGLKSCEAIISKHSGEIVIQNDIDTFKITLLLPTKI